MKQGLIGVKELEGELVSGNSKTPTNWRGFLRDSNNKTEQFNFLADKIAIPSTINIVIVTKGDDVMATQPKSLSDITPCSHEEAVEFLYMTKVL